MMSFFRIFKYIHIPRKKLSLYLFFTILATLFSLLSINALAPFMNIIFKADSALPGVQAKSLGRFNDFFQLLISNHGSLYALGIICALMIASILLKNVFVYLSLYISTPLRSKILADFRLRLYTKILQLPVGFFTEQKKGDLMSRMTADIGEVQGSIFTALEGLVKDPLIILSFLISMIVLSPHLSLFLLIFLPLTAIFI